MSNRFHRQDSNASVIPASAGAPADAAAGAVMLEDIHRMNSRASRISKSSRTDGGGLAGPAGQPRKLSVYDETDASSIKGDELEAAGRKFSGEAAEEEDHHVFGDEQPKNNLLLVMPALCLVLFIASMDQTIIATALPTIAAELNASHTQFSWIGTSYLLAQTLLMPINGRVSDIIGRKQMLLAAILLLLVFSAVCGASTSIEMLIAARFLTGLGGGPIIGLTMIIIGDIVPMHKRAAYQGYLGAGFGVAAVMGPILGGLITQKTTWRWCFYLNLPTCGVAFLALFFTLHLKKPTGASVQGLRKSFDFIGLILIMCGAALIIVGFSQAADEGFDAPSAYATIVSGGVLLILSIIHSFRTKRNAIIPPRLMRNRTTLFFTIGAFMNSMIFMPANFLLPQFFQGVRGFDSLKSGEAIIPFSLVTSVFVIISGQITNRWQITRPIVWAGHFMSCLGYGLFAALLKRDVSYATQEGIQILPGAGIGLAIQTPMMIVQAAMPDKDMAASMMAVMLVRSIAASVGVAIFTALLNSELRTKFSKIPGYGSEFKVPRNTEDYRALQEIPDEITKIEVLNAFSDSFKLCWIIGCGLLGFALVITLFTKNYSLDRHRQPIPSTESEDVEEKPPVSPEAEAEQGVLSKVPR